MTAQVLCLDGPLAGRLIDPPTMGGGFMADWPLQVPVRPGAQPERALYQLVKWTIGGRIIQCATSVPGGPADADVWEWLVSERGKAAQL